MKAQYWNISAVSLLALKTDTMGQSTYGHLVFWFSHKYILPDECNISAQILPYLCTMKALIALIQYPSNYFGLCKGMEVAFYVIFYDRNQS